MSLDSLPVNQVLTPDQARIHIGGRAGKKGARVARALEAMCRVGETSSLRLSVEEPAQYEALVLFAIAVVEELDGR